MHSTTIHQTYHDRRQIPYLVRDARVEDAPALINLLNRVGQEEIYIADEKAQIPVEQEAAIIRHRNPEVQLILVAEQEGAIAGSLEMVRGVLKKNAHTAIFGMALHPEFRGRGIGRGLLGSAEQWARGVGVQKVSLAVFASNHAAIRLYAGLGYEEEGRRYRQYRILGEWVDEIWMARWL